MGSTQTIENEFPVTNPLLSQCNDNNNNQPGCSSLENINKEGASRRLITAIGFSLVFMIAEIIGGYVSGSLAIMSDAVHLLSDVASFLISLFAITWSQRKASSSMSYGYHRAEILGALFSISTIWAMTAWILKEAIERLRSPTHINGKVMVITASLGVLVNASVGWLLHDHGAKHDHHSRENVPSVGISPAFAEEVRTDRRMTTSNISIRAAFIHVLGDLVQSVGVLLAAALIWWKPDWRIADPICTFFFSAIVVSSTWILARDTVYILMEGTPPGICPLGLRDELVRLRGVKEVHDLHVWLLSPGNAAATVHIVADWETSAKEAHSYEELLTKCQELMCAQGIHHVTIQVDPNHSLPIHCRAHCYGNRENFSINSAHLDEAVLIPNSYL